MYLFFYKTPKVQKEPENPHGVFNDHKSVTKSYRLLFKLFVT